LLTCISVILKPTRKNFILQNVLGIPKCSNYIPAVATSPGTLLQFTGDSSCWSALLIAKNVKALGLHVFMIPFQHFSRTELGNSKW